MHAPIHISPLVCALSLIVLRPTLLAASPLAVPGRSDSASQIMEAARTGDTARVVSLLAANPRSSR